MKQITLTQGQFAIVDDADFNWLNQFKWYARKHQSGNFYAARGCREKGKVFTIRMSRQILELEPGDKRQGDHQNHITLDNRRSNIRICSCQENLRNRKSALNSSSKYKGVCWYKPLKKWHAQITINKIVKHLGYFIKEELAALAYNQAAKKYLGKFANINLF